MPHPAVSILLPTYNRLTLLKEALASCMAQTFSDWECLVIVDGSNDGTLEYLATLGDPRFRIYPRENQGLCPSLNLGLMEARGLYVQIFNDDDRLLPTCLTVAVHYMEEHCDVGAVFGENLTIDALGRPLYIVPVTNPRQHILKMGVEWKWAKPLIRLDVARRVGFFKSEFDRVEDVDYWLRLRAAAPLGMIAQPTYAYRLHSGGSTKNRIQTFIMPALRMKLWHLDHCTISLSELSASWLFREYIRLSLFLGYPEICDLVVDMAGQRKDVSMAGLAAYRVFCTTSLGRLATWMEYKRRGFLGRLRRIRPPKIENGKG